MTMFNVTITEGHNTIDIYLQTTTQVLYFISLLNLPQNDNLFITIEYVEKERL